MLSVTTMVGGAVLPPRSAHAYTLNTPSDWEVDLDSNVAYTLGFRAQGRNPLIANNPLQQNSEYKFPNQGNVITNRFDYSEELSATYQQNYGGDISLDAWKDFAYNGGTQNSPNPIQASLTSSPNGRYGSYTLFNYNQGVELDNAFVFGNFTAGDVPVTIKVGRFTEYWGNSLFATGQAISYSQSAVDIIKAVDAPGTETKDLFMPQGQISVHAQITPAFMVGFLYPFEWRASRLPEGGTFMGIVDPAWVGPQFLPVAPGFGLSRAHSDHEPADLNGDFGIETTWSPQFLNGDIGLYYRQFDDTLPYAPVQLTLQAGGPAPQYRLAYARHERLYGVSVDHTLGDSSVGVEASFQQNVGLQAQTTVPAAALASDPLGNDGPRGDIFNVVANDLYGLTPTRLWQTGTLIGEVAWSHLAEVTHDKFLYNGVGYACSAAGLNPAGGQIDGCGTRDLVDATIRFDPQWLQVLPGLDVDAPMTASFGIHGIGQRLATNTTGVDAGSVAYSIGVHALYRQKYNVTLNYTGFHSSVASSVSSPWGNYYSGGVGNYMWNDKGQVLLTLSTSF
jgi:hypothetical protein